MGSYCKAYLAGQLRQFAGWTENAANVRQETQEIGGKEVEVERKLNDDSILYLQETYIVTDSHFRDEHIIFDQVSEAWKEFCHVNLRFEVPVDAAIEVPLAAAGGTPAGVL